MISGKLSETVYYPYYVADLKNVIHIIVQGLSNLMKVKPFTFCLSMNRLFIEVL